MQRRAFRGSDDISRGAGSTRFWNFDRVACAKRLGHAIERGQRLWRSALAEIAAGYRDAQTVKTAFEPGRHRLRRTPGAGRILGDPAPASRRNPTPNRASSAQTARDDRGLRRMEMCARD